MAREPQSVIPWTKPIKDDHPRLRMSNRFGPSVASIQAKANGSHASFWNQVRNYAVDHSNASNYPDSYFQGRAAEELAALAFSYRVGGNTSHGQRAVAVALDTMNDFSATSGSTTSQRERMNMMALVYDECFPLLTGQQQADLRTELVSYIQNRLTPDTDEFLWGEAHGNLCYAAMALMAILEDSNTQSSNDTRVGWMDQIFNAFYNGTEQGYFPGFRHFGNEDGGFSKGSGSGSYSTIQFEFYCRLFEAAKSALNVDLRATELWFPKAGNWLLWHLRGNQGMHFQGECRAQNVWDKHEQLYCFLEGGRQSGLYAEALQWLDDQIRIRNDGDIWGPFFVWKVLWYNTARAKTQPTIAGYGGGKQMKVFRNAGKVIFREGWGTNDISAAFNIPRYFLGGHQRRDAGHFSLYGQNRALLVEHGHYDSGMNETYKIPGSSTETGHRWVYAKRGLAHNVIRIFDKDEPNENPNDSFSRRPNRPLDRFGVLINGAVRISNYGGQLWPKADGIYQPRDIRDLVGAAAKEEWVTGAMDFDPIEPTSGPSANKYAYAVCDMRRMYYGLKQSRVRRHFVWIKPPVGSWTRPFALVFDDLQTHLDTDPTFGGKRTQIIQIQTTTPPVVSGSNVTVTPPVAGGSASSGAQLTLRQLFPACEFRRIDGYRDAQGELYPLGNIIDSRDDSGVDPNGASGVHRLEINPAVAAQGIRFVGLYFVSTAGVPPPSATLINETNWIGATVNGVDIRVRRDNVFQVQIGAIDSTPPAQPTGLGAVAGDNSVSLNWDDNAEGDLAGYRVYRQLKVGGNYGPAPELQIATTTASAYVDSTAINGELYRYRVSAIDGNLNESTKSAFVTDVAPSGAPPPPPDPAPAAPTGLVAVAGNGQVALNWNDNVETDLASYRVYVERFVGGAWEAELRIATGVGSSQYTHIGLTNGLQYRYRVGAVDNAGNESARSEYSNVAIPSAAPPPPDTDPPAAPTGLVASPGDNTVALNWDDNEDTDLAKYRVYRATKTAGVYGSWSQIVEISGTPPASQHTDNTAVNGTTYRYKVTALDGVPNESADSNIVEEITPSAPSAPLPVEITTQRRASIYRSTQQG